MTVLEQADWWQKRKEIYESLYPETKKGAKNQYTKDLLNAESAFSKQSFIDNTAKQTSKSKSTIKTVILP